MSKDCQQSTAAPDETNETNLFGGVQAHISSTPGVGWIHTDNLWHAGATAEETF